jgi:hypothetical protein
MIRPRVLVLVFVAALTACSSPTLQDAQAQPNATPSMSEVDTCYRFVMVRVAPGEYEFRWVKLSGCGSGGGGGSGF